MTDFTKPTRQSLFAVVLIIQKYINIVVRQVWPFIILILIGGNAQGYKKMLLPIVIGISVWSMIWAVISYFKYYFYIKEDDLIIEKGVLSKTKLNIPFERIQSVNFQQGIIHQVFGVIKVEIDTAGSSGSEFALDALSKHQAEELRSIILNRKKQLKIDQVDTISDVEQNEIEELIFNLSFTDLIKVGISQNHFRSGAIIIFFAGWFFSQLSDFGFDIENRIEEYATSGLSLGIIMILSAILLFISFSFIISLIRTVIVHFNLHLWRADNKYRLVKGLFTRKETSAVDQKIQILEWSDNPLKRIFNYFDVRLKQASSIAVRTSQSIMIPGCHPEHVQSFKLDWLGTDAIKDLNPTGVSIHYFIRRALYLLLASVIIIIAFYKFESIFFIPSFVLIPYFIITSYLRYKKAGFAINHEVIQVNSGIFENRHSLVPLYKMQSIVLTQTPYQFRRELADVRLMTASGSMRIPYISKPLATQLKDYLLFRIESDNRDWI